MIILPILFGRLRLFYKILTLNFWAPLAKLSFCVFLCHIGILIWYYGHYEGSGIMSGVLYFREFVVQAILSFIFAFIVWMLIEMPFSQLESAMWMKLRLKK